ncbi:PEP/pyruvate-binding domain-containing protein [Maridesulfovibrio sp.]|uniref:PEP/pyruvate-binding domain-containing protein n=1 Tax=Maridesulfovibrio sp. TaxID=2795000 RepID=UPI002A18D58B|nr:PEP/pyruvate-binding domain-containing protein [Maridesulfovibrio sp.]
MNMHKLEDFVLTAKIWKHRLGRLFAPKTVLNDKYRSFKKLLEYDAAAMDIIAGLEDVFYGKKLADRQFASVACRDLAEAVHGMVEQLEQMNPAGYRDLEAAFSRVADKVAESSSLPLPSSTPPYIVPLVEAGEYPHLTGGKGANLGRVLAIGDINVPCGFVITANAFNHYIEFNDLQDKLEVLLSRMEAGKRDRLAELTLEIQELILAGEVPPEVAAEVEESIKLHLPPEGLIAVRSSALAEDSEISFAGQYASELNIRREDVLDGYKRVLAGKYCPRAVSYRISNGLTDSDTAMAVVVIPMIEAVSAGVIYSVDPDCMNRDSIGIYAVRGVGSSLVDGSVVPSKVSLSRGDDPCPVGECAYDRSSLPPEEILTALARCALRLEEHFGCPQDVEWAVDGDGQFHILQTRPLQREHSEAVRQRGPVPVVPVIEGLEKASYGAGCGEIYFARTGAEIAGIPEGAVLVTPTLKPSLLTFSGNINAVLSETGSRASHFASVARELGIPVLVGFVMDRFTSGQVVTVDGVEGAVYDGCVEDVLTRSFSTAGVSKRVLDLYTGIIPHTVRLSLMDPQAPEFSPQGCRSLHDFVRFCHEMSVREMFSLVDRRGLGMGSAKRLETGLPLVVYLLDLDGGLDSSAARKKNVQPQDIRCLPMLHFWNGLSDERVTWPEEMTHVDWEEFDRMSAGIFSRDSKLLASYGILAEDYLHLLIRFGYHLSEVDSLCTDEPAQNYIRFRFKGGGAGLDNRLLRIEFIKRVLAHYGFDTELRGDMLDGFSSRLPKDETSRQLEILGYLLAVTRLMDMRLTSVEDVDAEVGRFIDEIEVADGSGE